MTMNSINPPELSVVIPMYNESESLEPLFAALIPVLEQASASWEILCINDGSVDNTLEGLRYYHQQEPRIRYISLSRNFGHQHALACGMDYAQGNRIFIIDADLQDPPELLPSMMEAMDRGADVVYGKRLKRVGEGFFKKISAKIFYKTLGILSEVPIPSDTGDFRLMSRRVVDRLRDMPERVRFQRGLVSWLGFTQVALEYNRDARLMGKTHYTISNMLRLAEAGIISFSTQPLRFAIWLGTIMVGFSIILLFYVFISYLQSGTVRGWASITAIFLIFQSLQFITLGILGGYLGVIFHEVKRRPLYIIDETSPPILPLNS